MNSNAFGGALRTPAITVRGPATLSRWRLLLTSGKACRRVPPRHPAKVALDLPVPVLRQVQGWPTPGWLQSWLPLPQQRQQPPARTAGLS
jgi:hypothetical protein